jgi:hypothetical protein
MEHFQKIVVIVSGDVTSAVVAAWQITVDMWVLVMAHISFQFVFSFLEGYQLLLNYWQ